MNVSNAIRQRRVFVRAVRVAARRMVAEPSALVVAGVFYLMVTAILAGLWRAAADASGGSVVGYSAVALVWYVATSEAATIALPPRMIEDIGNDIGSGAIAVEMLRPAPVLGLRVATEVGQMLPRMLLCISVGLVFATLTVGAPPSGSALALAAPSLVLALILNIVTQHMFAAAAFWVLDAKATWFLYQKLVFVTGGMLLPLEVLPEPLETVTKLLPFSAMAYVPARLASGHFEPELIAVQVLWLVVLGGAAHLAFRAGERHLIGTGA